MSKIEHTSLAGVNFEPNKKMGYYLVNNEIYYNKYQALMAATKTGHHCRWFFNEHTFVPYKWEVEPEESLRELYQQRAQQLRDQYDYIRVEASGGADSTTVIFSFLLNGIHLDEVVFRYPKGGEKDLVGDATDLRCENTLSEWEFAAKPLLNWIKTNYPAVKITVHDYTDNFADLKDETWIYRSRHYLQPAHAVKHQVAGSVEHKRLVEQNLKICILWGIDKPKVCIKDGRWYLYFLDGQGSHNNQVVDEYTNVSNEFFYWSPDACQLLAKQVHMVKRWFEDPAHYSMQGVLQWPNSQFGNRTIYEQVVKSIVYPDYDLTTFQTFKPTNNIYNEMDYWFHHNYKGTKQYSIWEAGIDYVLNNINKDYIKYMHGQARDIVMYESPLYYFGDSNITPTSSPFTTATLLRDNAVSPTIQHRHVINGKIVIY